MRYHEGDGHAVAARETEWLALAGEDRSSPPACVTTSNDFVE